MAPTLLGKYNSSTRAILTIKLQAVGVGDFKEGERSMACPVCIGGIVSNRAKPKPMVPDEDGQVGADMEANGLLADYGESDAGDVEWDNDPDDEWPEAKGWNKVPGG
ncbi:hypothetical protein LTR37_001478 [Vermiconidia calcicola]|uniref:Uncharacterized protein n=1 Tax=Vermiconidia calcicola TaxID=1690605 RepID=A0ACC3NVZ4_9PEZI|nr:hypothetical protein LTR37_001478 [Vermiconidia calcicola]